ncbi:MAG: exodeoxyribonuclease VII small subunit [Gammaproteobacteria bacterium]|nr:MAG: exodeoxyribonuclease VII small subunit [Gammaproteobacteria bacterium]RLA52979.1 MAG: exodeoxyribonuclease VII small subunit [Gammaproteobacteria bacterium]
MATRKKNIDFEASLQQLEAIVEVLEEGNLGLEESLKSFEKGIKITRDCQSALQNAEQRVRLLTTQPNGDVVNTKFVGEGSE